MRGRTPKPPHLRRGHHRRSSTRATLPTEAEAAQREVPPLPPRPGRGKWHPQVLEWWESVWTSPMAGEYLKVDRCGLTLLAVLQQDFQTASAKDRARYAAEIRRWEEKFGLDPVSRRRLEWEVDRAEVAVERTQARRQRKRLDPKKDPRNTLRVIT